MSYPCDGCGREITKLPIPVVSYIVVGTVDDSEPDLSAAPLWLQGVMALPPGLRRRTYCHQCLEARLAFSLEEASEVIDLAALKNRDKLPQIAVLKRAAAIARSRRPTTPPGQDKPPKGNNG